MLEETIQKIIEETVFATLKGIGVLDQSKQDAPETMNPAQLAQYLNMSESWVYQHTKELPHEKRGRKTLFIKSEIDEWRKVQRTAREEKHSKVVVVGPVRSGNNRRSYYKVV